jgi:hypothetical protein
MDTENPERSEVDAFVIEEIESVPHLEALLLVWNSRPRQWSIAEMAKSLYLSEDQTHPILRDLQQRHLLLMESDLYSYNADHPKGETIALLDRIYRHEIVRISTMIHAKPSASVRAFARAFKLKKD